MAAQDSISRAEAQEYMTRLLREANVEFENQRVSIGQVHERATELKTTMEQMIADFRTVLDDDRIAKAATAEEMRALKVKLDEEFVKIKGERPRQGQL